MRAADRLHLAVVSEPGSALQFIKRIWEEAQSDDIFNGAAALGFYLTLAIFPAMIFLMALIPYLPIPRVDQAIMEASRG